MPQLKHSPRIRTLVIGTVAGPLTRRTDRNGQSTLGAVVADALQAGAKPFDVTVAALVDPDDLRRDLPGDHHKGTCSITAAAGLGALPLSVTSTVVSLTGTQLLAALEAQFSRQGAAGRLMQVSQSVSYRWSSRPSEGVHVDPASVTVNSVPVKATANYIVVLSDGLRARGGNPVLGSVAPVTHGVTGVGGAHPGPLFDNLAAYLSTRPQLTVPTVARAVREG